jgi:hypothetical protein
MATFGLMFSEDRDWTASEVAAVIEDAADLYALCITATEQDRYHDHQGT